MKSLIVKTSDDIEETIKTSVTFKKLIKNKKEEKSKYIKYTDSIASITFTKDYKLRFEFNKQFLDESMEELLSQPTLKVEETCVLPMKILLDFMLPYHVIEKGNYPISETENEYMIIF